MPDHRLRILTYNIHKGFSPTNRHFILHRIRDALVEADPELLFLQEMQGEHRQHARNHENWPEDSHTEFVAGDHWPHFAYARNAVYSDGDHGNAILSKFALLDWENINVSPFPWASRSLLHGVIRPPGLDEDLHVICIHLGLIGMERRHQFRILRDRIDAHVPHHAPLIVAGDFNDWTSRAETHFYQHLQLREAYRSLHRRHARTFPAWLPFLKMDRIYFRGLQLLSCDRLSHAPWNRLSDHAPLLATFELHP